MQRTTSSIRDRARRGAKWGAVFAALYGLADLLSAFFAIGWLYDPGWPSFALVLFSLATALVLGTVSGVLVGCLVPYRLRARTTAGLAFVVAAGTFVTGVTARQGRNHELEAPGADAGAGAPVLFVVVDTLRADALYGDRFDFPLAPHTGEWARSAHVFEDAESTAGWTIPSMAAMLTGIHNATYDASAGRLPLWGTTLAEHLRGYGYETRAVVDNVILEPRNGFAQGFESFEQRSAFRFAFTFATFRVWPIEVHEWLRGRLYSAYDGSTDVTDRAIERIQQARDRPLLLYLHYMDPHAPYYPHPDLPPVSGEPVNYYRFRDYLREGVDSPPNAEQLAWLRGRYDREITHWDRDFKRLLEAWKKRYGETGLIILTSDHGEEFLDHGRLGHGMTVHREMVHVPLVIEAPASKKCVADARVEPLVSLLDLTPTIVEWATGQVAKSTQGLPAIQGRSWVPWLCGEEEPPERPAFARHSRHGRRVFRYRKGDDVAIRIHFFDDPSRVERSRYSLASDPSELTPLEDDDDGRRIESELHRVISAFKSAVDAARTEDESESVEESLRALGYIQ